MSTQSLGRGLNSLIPQKTTQKEPLNKISDISDINITGKDQIVNINLDNIQINAMQPRKKFDNASIEELADSIKIHGIIQPLVVSKKADNLYELIVGERRLRAAKLAGLTEVPAIVRDISQQKKLELALIENLQREDLNCIETAMAYKKLINEFNISNQELAERIGKPRSSVDNTLRMLTLPEEIQQALINQDISKGHAKYLAGLNSTDKQLFIFKKILQNNLTVDEANRAIREIGGTKLARVRIDYIDKERERILRNFFNTKVIIRRSGKGGRIIIDFYSNEELEEVIHKVCKEK